jgi:AcrR family transcriptional regulator
LDQPLKERLQVEWDEKGSPTRMNQSNSVIRDRIVEASIRLFSSQGFNGTSTREIARLADVNETSLFRYFPTKQNLFWAALQSCLDELRLRKELKTGLAQVGNPASVVPLIVELMVETSTYHPEVLKLLGISLLELRPRGELVWRQQLGPIFQAVVAYLKNCVTNGSLKPIDISISAIGLFAVVLGHQRMYKLLTGSPSPYANAADAVTAYSTYWLSVLLPESSANARIQDRELRQPTPETIPWVG